jgi:tRNA U34 2-thiouridine synthase MnmA/TrmU
MLLSNAMPPKPSVLVAMSGGVDSSVAACLLAEQGHQVLGSHLKLVHTDGLEHGCCGPAAESDARAVAAQFGFPFEVVDLSERFEERVIADYLGELETGRTPNPCVRCNERIKFGAFLDRARARGFDFVATGHYVRASRDDEGTWRLHRGLDRAKDQSYVLHMLGQEELGRSLFPIGGKSKAETRAHAERLGLLFDHLQDTGKAHHIDEVSAPGRIDPGGDVEAVGFNLVDAPARQLDRGCTQRSVSLAEYERRASRGVTPSCGCPA